MKIVDASQPPGAINDSDDSDDGPDLDQAPEVQKADETCKDAPAKDKNVADVSPVIC